MKVKHKKPNAIKQFKRFLKDNGIFHYYKTNIKPKEGIREFFKHTNPNNLFIEPPINPNLTKEEATYVSNYLKTYSATWNVYKNIYPNIDEIKNKFILFLKKRNIYDLYNNCVSPYYINQRIIFETRMNAWRDTNREPIVINELNNNTYSWEQLNPKFYLTDAFNIEDTVKDKLFWTELDKKWQKELSKIIS